VDRHSKFQAIDHCIKGTITNQAKYHKPIADLLESYRRKDPATQAQLAVPLDVIKHIEHKSRNGNNKQRAIGDMCVIAFFYLLRGGEYTVDSPKREEKKRPHSFRIEDVRLWEGNSILPLSLPLNELLQRCTAATLHLEDQKNGIRNQTIHQEALLSEWYCPIKAIIRRVQHVFDTLEVNGRIPPLTPLCTYFHDTTNKPYQVRPASISDEVKEAVEDLGLNFLGIPSDLVSSHSLRSGGAMALFLNNVDPITIQKLGRWTSTTWLDYIHTQISCFSKDLTKKMNIEHPFKNVAFAGCGSLHMGELPHYPTEALPVAAMA
jgi:hypothetical protein